MRSSETLTNGERGRGETGSMLFPEQAPGGSPKLNIVNFGCGPYPISGVQNIDGSLTVLLARLPLPIRYFGRRKHFVEAVRNHGIRFGLGRRIWFPDSSLDGFYTSHTLEHMPRHDCRLLLTRVRDWLKPSGVLRVVLPDLRRFAATYNGGGWDADTFVTALSMAGDSFRWWNVMLGHSHHRWMYDAASFRKLLLDLGYREVRERKYRESENPELARLDLDEHSDESFYAEAKP
jgi:hypothetical protein